MSTQKFKQDFKAAFFKDSERNSYIKDVLKELLYDVAKNPTKYTLEQNIVPTTRHLILKEITYILVISIKEFLTYAKNNDKPISSTFNAKSDLKIFINANIMKLRCEPNFLVNTCTILDKKLNKLYNPNEKVADDPVIQFIYWSIKNIPRLCIDPKKEILAYDVTVVLRNYFDNVFFAIDEYNENSKKMTSLETRNFLSSLFVDKILESEYYQKTFE